MLELLRFLCYGGYITLVEAELINSLNISFPGTCVSWTWRGTSSQPCHAGPCSWTCSTSMSRTTSCTRSFGRSTHRTSHRCYIVSDLAPPYIWALKKHWINLFLYFPVSYLIFFPLLSCVPLDSLYFILCSSLTIICCEQVFWLTLIKLILVHAHITDVHYMYYKVITSLNPLFYPMVYVMCLLCISAFNWHVCLDFGGRGSNRWQGCPSWVC